MFYNDLEIDNAIARIEEEFSKTRPKWPTEPDYPQIDDRKYDDLIGMRIQSALSGEGFVTQINKASNGIDVVLVVTYKDHKAGYLLSQIKKNPDLTLEINDLKKIDSHISFWKNDLQLLIQYLTAQMQYEKDSSDYLSRTENWNQEKQKKIGETIDSIQTKRKQKKKREIEAKMANVPEFDYKKHILYVYKGRNILCKKHTHDIVSVTCHLKDNEGNEIELNAEYCLNCKLFLISDRSYMDYALQYNLDLSFFRYYSSVFSEVSFYDANSSSLLKRLGYNVGSECSYSGEYRKKKLEQIIGLGLMEKHQVISHLEHLISFNGEKYGNEVARMKWKEDLEYVRALDIKIQPQANIDEVRQY